MALEIELQGLKEELFRERDLRRKEQFDDSVADVLKRKLIDMEHQHNLQKNGLFRDIKVLEKNIRDQKVALGKLRENEEKNQKDL